MANFMLCEFHLNQEKEKRKQLHPNSDTPPAIFCLVSTSALLPPGPSGRRARASTPGLSRPLNQPLVPSPPPQAGPSRRWRLTLPSASAQSRGALAPAALHPHAPFASKPCSPDSTMHPGLDHFPPHHRHLQSGGFVSILTAYLLPSRFRASGPPSRSEAPPAPPVRAPLSSRLLLWTHRPLGFWPARGHSSWRAHPLPEEP